MNEGSDKTAEQFAAFQKIWTDSFSRMAQAACTFTPESAPPDVLKQIRQSIFQALSHSWDEFLRSPQFLEGMKQWMDQAVTFRKMSNDFLNKARHDTQQTSREDVDAIMLTVRHLETRILDRVEQLAKEVSALNARLDSVSGKSPKATGAAPKRTKPAGRSAPQKRR
jgi:hypothetical protein